ncbi:MAG: hypothetical protein WHS88_04645 [Anaerohalosphaeraceae bacterium]
MFAIPAGIGLSYLLLILYFLSICLNQPRSFGLDDSSGNRKKEQKDYPAG